MNRENTMSKKTVLITLTLVFFILSFCPEIPGKENSRILEVNIETAVKFADMALRCIEREYPNKPSHVMNSEQELWNPRTMHPAFFGCFDWHSAVHGHWMLIRLLKTYPDLPAADTIRTKLNQNLSADNMARETRYFQQEGRKSFERTYGWAWLLKLVAELDGWNDIQAKTWRQNMKPLEKQMVRMYREFFPKQTYPIRTGVHPNTAFGLGFALDYARQVKNGELESLIIERSKTYFFQDRDCPGLWEPGGEDFFSPCLMEADLMRRILDRETFVEWFLEFLPDIGNGKPRILLEPAIVTDRSDGKLVHLDGLNLSRAWCMKHISKVFPESHPARKVLWESAVKHTTDALNNISSGDYAGEHWLASFATYLLTE